MKRKGGELAVLDNRTIKKAHEEVFLGYVVIPFISRLDICVCLLFRRYEQNLNGLF